MASEVNESDVLTEANDWMAQQRAAYLRLASVESLDGQQPQLEGEENRKLAVD